MSKRDPYEFYKLYEALENVPAFRPLSFKKQPVSRAAALLHPLFARTLGRLAAAFIYHSHRIRLQNLQVNGTQHLPSPKKHRKHPKRGQLFICNHLSYLDPPLVGAVLTSTFRNPWFMAKKKHWENLSYRLSFAILGALPFQRKSTDFETTVENYRAFISLLKAGEPLIIYPEGTIPGELERGHGTLIKRRSDVLADTALLPAGPLAAFLAYTSNALVYPLGISGAGRLLPPEIHPGKLDPKRKFKDHVIKINLGPAIDVQKELDEKFDSLKERLEFNHLKDYTNQRLMKAISNLVDFSLHEVPHSPPPLSSEDYERIRAFEKQVAQKYSKKGQGDFAQLAR